MEYSGIFVSQPKNGANIVRSQTISLRAWMIPRTGQAISIFQNELSQDRFPSIYILFEGNKKVYIGETETIINRLRTHNDNPQEGIKQWNSALVINDGRPARFSDFNDTAVRHSLEYYTKQLFSYNQYKVTSAAREQQLTASQTSTLNMIKSELNYLLMRLNLIDRFLDREEEREVFTDELKEILEEKGYQIEEWGEYEAKINNQKYFIRGGSKKKKGYQITSRGRKTGSFIDLVMKGEGYVIVRRGKILIVPLQVIKEITDIENDTERDTTDIFIDFRENQIILKYHERELDVTRYKLLP